MSTSLLDIFSRGYFHECTLIDHKSLFVIASLISVIIIYPKRTVSAIVNYCNIGPRSRLTVTYNRVTRGIVLLLTIGTFDHRFNRECQRGNRKFRRKRYRGSEKSCRTRRVVFRATRRVSREFANYFALQTTSTRERSF